MLQKISTFFTNMYLTEGQFFSNTVFHRILPLGAVDRVGQYPGEFIAQSIQCVMFLQQNTYCPMGQYPGEYGMQLAEGDFCKYIIVGKNEKSVNTYQYHPLQKQSFVKIVSFCSNYKLDLSICNNSYETCGLCILLKKFFCYL